MPRFATACLLSVLAAPTLAAQGKPPAAARKADADRPVWPDEGPRTWAPRPTSPEINANDLRTRLYQFADDSMLGRRVGEPGNFKATAYIASEFRRLGLKPAGDNGTYFQELPFGPIGVDGVTARLAAGGTTLAPRSEWIPVTPTTLNRIAGSANFADLPAVFAGRWGDTGVVLDPAHFRGKVAVFLMAPGAPGYAAPARPSALLRCDSVPDRFGAAAAIKLEAAAAANAAARGPVVLSTPAVRDGRAQAVGAAAVLVVGLEQLPAGAVAAALGTRQVMQPATPANALTMPAAVISNAAATRIFGRPAEQLAVGATGEGVSAAWSYSWHPSSTPARNVVAVLPGTDPALAGEYVLVSAHNDHVGTNPVAADHDSLRAVLTVTRRQGANDPACRPTAEQQQRIDSLVAYARGVRPPRRDSIMNGADDDGSGTVVLLEIAERFATEKPARSIIFVSHTGEEGGLLGSRWFVDHPTVPLGQVVAAHNMDMLGKGRVEQVKFGGPNSVQLLGARRLSREFGDIIDSVNATRAEPMALDKSWDVRENPLNRFCRSDQVSYVLKDVPVTYFSLGYAQDYHQLTDEPQYIDYDHAARLARFIHDVMWAIAMRKDRPAIAGPDPAYPQCR
ncbi:MAG: M28 family peptidase [Gemmatimonadetes bacterium]|nr:M28 family peptidase [Gemmatimonadota bacterium]